jgi:hypothetical protein
MQEGDSALPSRRTVLVTGLHLAAASVVVGLAACAPTQNATTPAQNDTSANSPQQSILQGRRRLGSLEVSSIGLGVQNMSRTYQTTIPSPEARAATIKLELR